MKFIRDTLNVEDIVLKHKNRKIKNHFVRDTNDIRDIEKARPNPTKVFRDKINSLDVADINLKDY